MERRRQGCRRRAYRDVFTAFPEIISFNVPSRKFPKQIIFVTVSKLLLITHGQYDGSDFRLVVGAHIRIINKIELIQAV